MGRLFRLYFYYRDDLEEPYILPDSFRFEKMCKTGSLGDYLGLPTFGTRISSTVTLTDTPCAANSRNFTDSPLETVMNQLRADKSVPGSTCAADQAVPRLRALKCVPQNIWLDIVTGKQIGRAHV